MMITNNNTVLLLILGTFFFFASCDNDTVSSEIETENSPGIEFLESSGDTFDKRNHTHTGGYEDAIVSEFLEEINAQLAENGLTDIELVKAETITSFDGGEFQNGLTIFANDRVKKLASQWVPADERRGSTDNTLTYIHYAPLMTANGTIDAEPSIDSSFETWNSLKKNSGPELVKLPPTTQNPSAILEIGGEQGDPFLGDITTLGFLPGSIFDLVLGPGTSESVLGVAFTFTWTGTNEVALKEIWYNDSFAWSTNEAPGTIDIESVALHENGHALGFAHFGLLAINNGGNLIVAPQAVMNASYLGPQKELLGTDKASFNSIYGNWPKD